MFNAMAKQQALYNDSNKKKEHHAWNKTWTQNSQSSMHCKMVLTLFCYQTAIKITERANCKIFYSEL